MSSKAERSSSGGEPASSSRPSSHDEDSAPATTGAWRLNLGLFLATVASVCMTGMLGAIDVPKDVHGTGPALWWVATHLTGHSLLYGAQFAGTLLTILVAHELGHYIAARIHRVDASLPFFIPMPLISPFGTMGAVIRMRGIIPTRRALLDIGASGPLAGMAFAIPLYAWGVAHMRFVPTATAESDNLTELGESLLIKLLDHFFALPSPEGMTAVYSPVAFGAWGGFFVTMINMLPVGQLDGGHVAYALFGPKQNRYAQLVHRAMLVFFFVIVLGHIGRDFMNGAGLSVVLLGRHIANAVPWLVWFQLLAILGSVSARGRGPLEDSEGRAHAATHNPAALSIRTRIIVMIGLVALASIGREHGSWLVVGGFFIALGLLIAMEVRGGVLRKHDLLDHPPTGPDALDGVRKAVAIATLVMFALLFMPEPFSL